MEIIKSQSATTYRRRNHRLADENGVHDQPETLHPCKECKMNEILNKKPKRTPRSSEDARIWPEESPVRELGTEGLGGGERSRYRGSKSTKTASDYNSAGDAARGVDEIEARRVGLGKLRRYTTPFYSLFRFPRPRNGSVELELKASTVVFCDDLKPLTLVLKLEVKEDKIYHYSLFFFLFFF